MKAFTSLAERRPLRAKGATIVGACALSIACSLISSLVAAEEMAAEVAEVAAVAVTVPSGSTLEDTPMGDKGAFPVDFLWTVMAAILVFWMQAGFAMVEAGFTRAKNAVNIFMKNLMDYSLGSIAFWLLGFGLMFGTTAGGFIGTDSFALSGIEAGDMWPYAFLMFQTVFAATAATIVSGAMAERTKFAGYVVYSVLVTALIYPIFGSWAWGSLYKGEGWLEAPDGGFLAKMGLPGFIDFAGSTVVHSVGGWAALAGTLVLGPRMGKYDSKGHPRPIPGHSMALSTLGVFILWMGWFGFNAGSTTAVTGDGGKQFAWIAVNTNLAAAGGAAAAMVTTWVTLGKPDIGMSLNGTLAGLVGITAPCANVTLTGALMIGLVAGVLVVFSVQFFENRGIDDPVGAISVHGVCGAWGTLAAALFNIDGFSGTQLLTQFIGAASCFAWTFGAAYLMFRIIKVTVGLRVDEEDEEEGLDLSEHGSEAYPPDIP